jgi:hypothetical protein
MEEACPTPRCVFGGFKLKSELNHASAQHESRKINYIARETGHVEVLLVSCVVTQMAVAPVVTNTTLLPPSTGHQQHFSVRRLLDSSDGPSIRQWIWPRPHYGSHMGLRNPCAGQWITPHHPHKVRVYFRWQWRIKSVVGVEITPWWHRNYGTSLRWAVTLPCDKVIQKTLLAGTDRGLQLTVSLHVVVGSGV